MIKVTILVGTVYGGALATAKALSRFLAEQGVQTRVVEQPDIADLEPTPGAELAQDILLVCTSTTGQGEVPANLLPFYLTARDTLPFQHGRPFGLVVLGDSSYGDTFCGAGALMQELFLEMGCRQLGETLQIDAWESAEPEIAATAWCANWLTAICQGS